MINIGQTRTYEYENWLRTDHFRTNNYPDRHIPIWRYEILFHCYSIHDFLWQTALEILPYLFKRKYTRPTVKYFVRTFTEFCTYPIWVLHVVCVILHVVCVILHVVCVILHVVNLCDIIKYANFLLDKYLTLSGYVQLGTYKSQGPYVYQQLSAFQQNTLL